MNAYLRILTITVLACSPLCCLAKSDSAKVAEFARENFIDKQALNVSYRLGLTDDKRMQFIKLYSEYLKQMMEMPVVGRPAQCDLSEADYDSLNKQEIERSRRIIELRNVYDSKFRKLMSAKQLYRLHEMERSDIKRMKALDRKQRIKANESWRKARNEKRRVEARKRKIEQQAAARKRRIEQQAAAQKRRIEQQAAARKRKAECARRDAGASD